MRAVVTGGAGFVGSHLVDALLAGGHSVTVLDDLSTGRVDNLTFSLQNHDLELICGSVLDPEVVDDVVSRNDVVFHLAAAVGTKLIVEQPLESLLTNIRGTEILLEKAEKHGKKVLLASSSEIYGKVLQTPVEENADRLLGPALVSRWSYSIGKAVDEFLTYEYFRCKDLPTVIARLFNTTGPRQSPAYGMVIPRLIDQSLAGRPLTVHGDGSQTRCFAYVGDIVSALIALMECPEAEGLAVNLGSTEEISILSLAELVLELTGSNSPISLVPYDVAFPSGGFEDIQRRVPSVELARRLIGFAPRTSLRELVGLMVGYAREDTAAEA